ncbi:MAG TPA: class I SAM-dependent methyltransferase [Burkholderiaceae bacterium]|nr:class I SAM-dependent methyltransferase [Burkholderiaceae bacterium]
MLPINMVQRLAATLVLVAAGSGVGAQTATQAVPQAAPPPATSTKPLRSPDVIYVPTPPEVVDAMLKVAKVRQGDVLYDLGSGDGRIPITAAQKFSVARATGIEINPERIQEAEQNLKAAGVGDRVRFRNEDLFEANFSDATVITLYLLPALNVKLLPKLLKELKPGTRIVSHAFAMGDWKPELTLEVGGRSVYFWTIPAKGTADYAAAAAAAGAGGIGSN